MVIRTIAAALTLALLACTLQAQTEYTGYPGSRVRLGKPESIPPDELYQQNRIIVRRTDLVLAGNGMQISGEVVTDFDADRVPPDRNDLPKGQLMGLKVNVELYYWDTAVERDPKNGNKAKMPQIDLKRVGTLVEGQSVVVTIDQSFERFGLAKFTLPQLTKPLAPGIYRLVASLRFKTQDAKLLESIKWCSDLYGARPVVDEDTLVVTFKNVMQNADLHDEVYDFLVNTTATLRDETQIWIGEVWKDGNLNLIPAEKGTDKTPANYLIWSYHMNVVGQLLDYQNQLDNVDKVVDAELAAKLKTELKKNATQKEIDEHEARKEKWKLEAVETKKRIKRDNKVLIDKLGGRTSKEEDKRHISSVTARVVVLEQIARLHDYLSRRYWVLTDGFLQYTGWNTVYQPGYNACDAVQNNNNKATSDKRKDALEAAKAAPGGIAAKRDARRAQWKFVPPDLFTMADAYLKAKEETDVYDAEKFTKVVASKVEWNVDAWSKFRLDFILDFYEKSNTMFKQVITTEVYAVQVWPQALSQLISARDDVIALAYAWDYYTRKELMKEDAELIKKGWALEAAPIAAVPLADYFSRAMSAPGTIKTRFDGSLTVIKSAARIGDFIAAYSAAVAMDPPIEAKYLPGVRPPSAPTKEG
jgi:hypothetical protein